MFKLIQRIKTHIQHERLRREKLKAMFQPGKQVQCAQSGEVYFVAGADSDLCFAILRDGRGHHHAVSWLTGAQTVKTQLADQWNPVVQ